jgi:hypothetical protein
LKQAVMAAALTSEVLALICDFRPQFTIASAAEVWDNQLLNAFFGRTLCRCRVALTPLVDAISRTAAVDTVGAAGGDGDGVARSYHFVRRCYSGSNTSAGVTAAG